MKYIPRFKIFANLVSIGNLQPKNSLPWNGNNFKMPDSSDPKPSPKYSGLLQNNDKNPKTRKTLGRVFLWEGRQQSPNSPAFYGRLHTKYGQSSLVLWPYKKKAKSDDDSEFQQIWGESVVDIPGLYETESLSAKKKVIYQKWEMPQYRFYWLIAELDKAKKIAYGYANLNNDQFAEWGYISIKELMDNRAILCKDWKPCTFEEAQEKMRIRRDGNLG